METAKRRKVTGEGLFECFSRQEEALQYISGHVAQRYLRCWAREMNANGIRQYIVSTVDTFVSRWWREVSIAKSDPAFNVSLHEVIRECEPCHLYFDVEFYLAENPELNGDAMIDCLLRYCFELLKRHFGVCATVSNVVQLDASTVSKFSRHVIVHMPNAVFRNNLHCGQFVFAMLDELAGRREFDKQIDILFVNKQSDSASSTSHGLGDLPQQVPCCDVGVYTRNRCFRLYRTTKFDKKNPFLWVSPPTASELDKKEKAMTDSKRDPDEEEKEAKRFKASLVVPWDELHPERVNVLEWKDVSRMGTNGWRPRNSSNSGDGGLDDRIGTSEGGPLSIPFPSIRLFLEALFTLTADQHPMATEWQTLVGEEMPAYFTQYGALRIRRWKLVPQTATLIVSTFGNRFCMNIGREHKSNTQYYVFDLQRQDFVQKCYDPDCRYADYRSFPMPLLPSFHVPSYLVDALLVESALLQDREEEPQQPGLQLPHWENDPMWKEDSFELDVD
jgi:hypothetical protein